jgi:hypothetical protein
LAEPAHHPGPVGLDDRPGQGSTVSVTRKCRIDANECRMAANKCRIDANKCRIAGRNVTVAAGRC